NGSAEPCTTRRLRSGPINVRGEAFGRLAQITLADDVVTVEDRARLVSAHLHGDPFGNASPHHVPNRRASQIVKQAPGRPRGAAGTTPWRLKMMLQREAVSVEHKRATECARVPTPLD